MRIALLILALTLVGCGKWKLVRDTAPASIDMGHKRVETMICGSHEVGENGCAFTDGEISGDLKVYRILEGNISLIAQGCGVDKTIRYTQTDREWISLDLVQLIGKEKLTSDCVMTIYQVPDYPGQEEAPYPIEGIYGTVTLGTCPSGVACTFSGEQWRLGWPREPWTFEVPKSGSYTLRGCGQEITPATPYNAPLMLDLMKLWPGGYPSQGKTGCLFIAGLRSGAEKYKHYRKISLYKEETMLLGSPVLTPSGKKLKFQGDKAVTLTIVQGNLINGAEGSYTPDPDGDILRFYTIQGRSLVVFVKGGKIVWTK